MLSGIDLLRALALASLLGACSASSDAEPPPRSVASDSGALLVDLETPNGVMRGKNTVALFVHEASSEAGIEQLELDMLPFMPAMGHGSGFVPEVNATGGGRYEFSGVVLNMAGRWQLRTTIAGSRSDYVALEVDVP